MEKIVRILGAVLEESKFAFLKFYEKRNDHELLSYDSNSFFKIIPFWELPDFNDMEPKHNI